MSNLKITILGRRKKGHYKVIINGVFSYEFINGEENKLYLRNPQLFRKYRGFGVHKEILENPQLNIKSVKILYDGVYYIASQEQFIKYGISQIFPEGEKLYLPLSKFKRIDFSEPTLFD